MSLLATTALALSAGVASAEITFSGSARMGVVYTGKVDGKAAVQGSFNAVTAEWWGGSTEAGDAVTAENMLWMQNEVADAQADVDSAFYEALDMTADEYADAQAAIAASEDADAAAELADAVATANEDADVVAARDYLAETQGYLASMQGSDAVAAKASAWALDNRMTINIDGSTETSSGLTFGGRLRIRSNDGNNASVNGARVYMKSGAVEVAVGNIYGALDSMPGMYNSEVGLTALADAGVVTNVADGARAWGFDGYSSTGSQMGVEAIYSAGAFTGHLSVTDSDAGSASDRVAAVGAYTMGDWTVALGVQDSQNNAEDKTVLTVGGKVGDFGVGFAAADNDGVQKIALNGSATFGATTVNGFVADDESGTDTAMGLGVSYDVGGAAVMAGVERDAVGVTRADMGVSFSF